MIDLPNALRHELQANHYSSQGIEGVGGILKQQLDDFCVDELMPYSPCGEGEHTYIRLRRANQNTSDVGKALARLFKVPMRDIGWAGLKDKHAVTTQTFSLRLGWHADPEEVRNRLASETEFDILDVAKHGNKIKRGHVKVNRFSIILRDVTDGALVQARLIADVIREKGVPNFFGEQRFSRDLRNIEPACRIFQEQTVRNRQDTFMVSVLQSALFNIWLNRRFDTGTYDGLLLGDIAQKCDSGGLFTVEDLDLDQTRFVGKEIVYTGPIYGYDMKPADGIAGGRETEILDEFEVRAEQFKSLKAAGTRRAAIIYPESLNVDATGSGLKVAFELPSGCYATGVMREFMKLD